MRYVFKKFIQILITYLLLMPSVNAEDIIVFKFTDEELSEMEVRKVRGADAKTLYSVASNQEGNYLKAVAENAASGVGKEVKINLNITPFINITWKVEKDLKGIKEDTKKGHDLAARVIEMKKTGATALSNRAINYVFSSNSNVGEAWTST